jgi:hypothetical protein
VACSLADTLAHLAGTSPGYDDPPADSAMAVLATAVPRLRPAESWAAFRRLPLTRKELARIASNVAPYLR